MFHLGVEEGIAVVMYPIYNNYCFQIHPQTPLVVTYNKTKLTLKKLRINPKQ